MLLSMKEIDKQNDNTELLAPEFMKYLFMVVRIGRINQKIISGPNFFPINMSNMESNKNHLPEHVLWKQLVLKLLNLGL